MVVIVWSRLSASPMAVAWMMLYKSSSNCSHSLRLLAGGHLIHCWTTLLGFGGSGTWRDRTLWVASWPVSSCVSPGSGPVRCTSLSRSKHLILAWNIQLYDSFWTKPSSWRAACCGRSLRLTSTWARSPAKRIHLMLFHLPSAVLNHSWPGSFITGTAPSFSIKCKSSVELGLINRSSTNTLEKLHCCPRKTNCIHCLHNAGFFRKLNKVIFPSQPKIHSFRDILPERVPCSAAESSTLMGALALALVDACTGALFQEKCMCCVF